MTRTFAAMRGLPVLLIAALASLPMLAALFALLGGPDGLLSDLWQTVLPAYLLNTIGLMLLTGTFAAIVGTGTAWCVTMLEFPGRRWLAWSLVLPLAAPAYIIAYFYADLLEFYGPVQSMLRNLTGWNGGDYSFPAIRNLPGGALMLGLVLYPYVYLLARAAFLRQSSTQWHAARSLGQTPMQAFWRVALPSARPAVAGGLALVLMETLADFGVADHFGIPTFSTGIFRAWLAGGDKAAALKLAGIMLLGVFVLIMLEAASRRGRVATRGSTAAQTERINLSRGVGYGVATLCILPILFGFLIPFFGLGLNAISYGDSQFGPVFLVYARNSLTVALLVSVLALMISLFLAYAQRGRENRPLMRGGLTLATLGYALPGALLAVGLLAPLGVIDRGLTRWAMSAWGWDGGLILTGTIIALVYALIIRFLTVSYNSVTSGLAKVPLSMDQAARSLGASPGRVVRRIQVPLLRSSLAAGLLLVFIDVMRELPATLILRPFNFDTLATRVYWLASDERLNEASLAAILIMLVSIVPAILLRGTDDH